MIHPFRVIKSGIKNLITWFPVIWNDQQWDQYYLLVIVQKKLKLMEKYFKEKGCHVDADKDAENIRLAHCLLDRIIKDDYMTSAFVPHKKKYGESDMITIDDPENLKLKILEIIYEKNPETEEEKKKERELFLRCMNREDYLRKQDLDLLFKHLKKHIFEWWD